MRDHHRHPCCDTPVLRELRTEHRMMYAVLDKDGNILEELPTIELARVRARNWGIECFIGRVTEVLTVEVVENE